MSAAHLSYDPEPQQDWLVEDMIPGDNLTLITGKGGGGKTTLTLHLAVAMQIDALWLNMRVKQGPALFVSSEETRKDLNMSLRAILKVGRQILSARP